jgi:predicted NBD/HSP70 family sugar kinase
MKADVRGTNPLAGREIPRLRQGQVERFTLHSLRATQVRSFDPQGALSLIRSGRERTVLAIDIGGDKLVWSLFATRKGILEQTDQGGVTRSESGGGYLAVLEDLASLARRDQLPVGISFAGPVDGEKPIAGPNLGAFMAELHSLYEGDFGKMFSDVKLSNDAEAGILAGSVGAASRYDGVTNTLYVINGSGIGGAVLKGKLMFASEPGHVELESQLNFFGQRKACGLLGASYVCVDRVAASKAGIEDIWFQQRGERQSGRVIAARYLASDPIALDLYDNSAIILAHMIVGMAKAFGLLADLKRTVVVGHGGIFEVPGYYERLLSIVTSYLPSPPLIVLTKDFSANACLEGAAIAGLTKRTVG